MSDSHCSKPPGEELELLPALFKGLSPVEHKETTTVVFRRDATCVIQIKRPEAMELWRRITGEAAESDLRNPVRVASLAAKLERGAEPRSRFREAEKIGEGGCALVYKVHEANLDREVALKVLRNDPPPSADDVERFILEAGVVAGLEHPGIIPVYDLDADADGRVYMCMQRVEGITLKEYIDQTGAGRTCRQIPTIGELIQVFLKVCDAMAYAHSKNTVHQDLKPANIMIGEYGEVFVIDWGASATADDELALTPVYMSPQQACCRPPTPADDVYCLGATLFHCLLGRFPTDAETLVELVRKKQRGEIDPIQPAERERVPAPLLAIALKAIEPRPEDRYQNMTEFSEDLRRYQEGLAVSAYSDTLFEFLKRWSHRHRQALLSAAAVFFTAVVLAGGFGWRIRTLKARQIASWRQTHWEDFSSPTAYLEDWQVTQGTFTVEDGRLVSGPGHPFYLTYKHRLYGSHALEYTGEVPPGTRLGDLSLVWYENNPFGGDKDEINRGKYLLQVGGWYNSFSLVDTRNNAVLAYHPFRLEHGRKYRIRGEVDGHYLRIFVDGRKLCEYRREFPFASGWFGIYVYYQGKCIDDIRLYAKGGAELVSATKIGDSYYQRAVAAGPGFRRDDLFRQAMHEYDIVMNSVHNPNLRQEARYKRALCLLELQHREDALDEFRQLQGSNVNALAQSQLLLNDFNQGNDAAAVERMKQLFAGGTATDQAAVHRLWERIITDLRSRALWRRQQPYLQLRADLFPDDPMHRFTLAALYNDYGRYRDIVSWTDAKPPYAVFALEALRRHAELVQRFPDVQYHACRSLAYLGQIEQARRRFPQTWRDRGAGCLFAVGEFDQIDHEFPRSDMAAFALHVRGRFEDILAAHQDKPGRCADALLALGRYHDVLARYPNQDAAPRALICLGLYEEVLKTYPNARGAVRNACRRLGRTEDLLDQPNARLSPADRREILSFLGRAGQLVTDNPANSDVDRLHGLMQTGAYRRILREYPFAPGRTGAALIEMGRAGEISLETHGRDLWAAARLETGHLDDVAGHFDLGRHRVATALFLQGRDQAILDGFRDQTELTVFACLRLRKLRAAKLAAADNFDLQMTCRQYDALELAENGELQSAIAILDSFTDVQVGWTGHGWDHYLMPAFLRFLGGNYQALRQRLRSIVAQRRHVMSQTLWHDAAFLLGEIDEKAYRGQPCRRKLQARLLLVRALKAEIDGDPAAARNAYDNWLELPAWQRPLSPIPAKFVRWRRNALP